MRYIALLFILCGFLSAGIYTADKHSGMVRIFDDECVVSADRVIIKGDMYEITSLRIHTKDIDVGRSDFTIVFPRHGLPKALTLNAVTKYNEYITEVIPVPDAAIAPLAPIAQAVHADVAIKDHDLKSFKQRFSRHSVYIGLRTMTFDYKEDLDPPAKSEEFSDSLLGVFAGGVLFDPSGTFFVTSEIDYAQGDVAYDGSMTNFSTGVVSPYQDTSYGTWLDTSAKAGMQFACSDRALVRVYSGLGVYSWNRSVCKQYMEKYSYVYLPLGLAGDYFVNDQLSVGVDAGVTTMLTGRIAVYFSESEPDPSADPDASMTLGNRQGYYYSVPLKIYLDDITLVCAPYYVYRPIGKSNTATLYDGSYIYSIYEPGSSTILRGVKLWASCYF